MSLYFDNEKLFDAEGHLTDAGLYALKDGTLDDLGALFLRGGLHLLLAGDGHRAALLRLGLRNAAVGLGLIHLQLSPTLRPTSTSAMSMERIS